MSQQVLDKISKAKIHLMLKGSEAFLSTLVLSLETIIDDSIPTAATNGLCIKYNPDFVSKLSDQEMVFLIAHETWHVAFMHMCRLGDRNHHKFNIAADYAINLMLKDAGYTLIPNVLVDSKYKGMSAEEIYDLLDDDDLPENPQDGDFEPSEEEGDEEGNNKSAEIEQKIQDAIIKAATAAEMSNQKGNIPAGIAKMIDKILNPQLPWQVILSNYMSAKTKAEKSWSRRNKRFRSTYLPSRLSESMGNVNIYVDASGSVSKDEFTTYISEMHEIRESLKPECMKVISFDTSLKDEFVMEKGEDIKVSFKGGGGTCIEPVIKHAEQEETDVTIIFTDGFFSGVDYTNVPNDILWVIVNNESWTCPVGNVIHMKYKG